MIYKRLIIFILDVSCDTV